MNDSTEVLQKRRLEMVKAMQEDFVVKDPLVIEAIATVPRHRFVDEEDLSRAYEATHLFVKNGVTISHPGFVAYTIEQLKLTSSSRVLDIGGGTGYHAAVMGQIAEAVYSVEYIAPMVIQAQAVLKELGYDNVFISQGDGFNGMESMAPFDAINIVCTVEQIPIQLVNQLKVGGRMILPIGSVAKETGLNAQKLVLVEKIQDPFVRDGIHYDSFYNSFDLRWAHVVPMVGIAQNRDVLSHP